MRMRIGKPRAAHCLGCGNTFNRMHEMINHRRNKRCGGRFLPEVERNLYDKARFWCDEMERANDRADQEEYIRCFDNRQTCLNQAYTLRKHRLAKDSYVKAA